MTESALLLIVAVEYFHADAQPLAQLPDEIAARILRLMIGIRSLRVEPVHLHSAERAGGTPLREPLVRVAAEGSVAWQRLQIPVVTEGCVGGEEVCIVPVVSDPFAVGELAAEHIVIVLVGLPGELDVQSRAEIEAPSIPGGWAALPSFEMMILERVQPLRVVWKVLFAGST